jgi:hypothetical protein
VVSNPKEKPLLASQICTKPYENATFGLSILRPCGWAVKTIFKLAEFECQLFIESTPVN